ncbi:glycosyltransferase family 2 protein [uncultured Polaribacter sp.]|uniref:glycosyltransferase family 2 protein n=1 Tax=uncultured Polaribacter sp. TaxID=174711 RepID=UPI0026144EDC|nr:glycosyltransferase family 2 protein [uncultured Polaribacter sp.]
MTDVSIILPSYNHALFLEERLNSIINQTFSNWKLIIIDDCSKDNSLKILKKFKEKYPNKIEQFIVNKTNSGSGYNSWNLGIKLAKSDYIWIAETDDYSAPTFLEEQVTILEANKDVALSFCASNYVNQEGEYLYDSTNRLKKLEVVRENYGVFSSEVFTNSMPFHTLITNGSSVVFRKPQDCIPEEIFTFKQCSDIFFWTHLLKCNKFIFLNKNLNYFRRHEDSTSTKNFNFNLLSVYKEKIEYLNIFKQHHKYEEFIEHYVIFYVLKNKSKFHKIDFLKKLNNIRFIKIKYYKILFKIFLKKLNK